ncbi:MAG: hypothetical protein AVDCRST_MAG93-3198, partial [uncultured Chloroflexia bacterium]
LDGEPPAAIVVGYETHSKRFRIHPDERLRAYAKARGYRLERSPLHKAELYINPRASTGTKGASFADTDAPG